MNEQMIKPALDGDRLVRGDDFLDAFCSLNVAIDLTAEKLMRMKEMGLDDLSTIILAIA